MSKRKDYDKAVAVGGSNGPKCISAASGSVRLEETPEVSRLTERIADSSMLPGEHHPVHVVKKSSSAGKKKGTAAGRKKGGTAVKKKGTAAGKPKVTPAGKPRGGAAAKPKSSPPVRVKFRPRGSSAGKEKPATAPAPAVEDVFRIAPAPEEENHSGISPAKYEESRSDIGSVPAEETSGVVSAPPQEDEPESRHRSGTASGVGVVKSAGKKIKSKGRKVLKRVRKTSKIKKIALTVSIVFAVGVIGIIIYVLYSMNSIVNSINYVPNSLSFDKVELLVSDSEMYDFVSHTDETKNILLCGSDIDKYGVSRTDSMIILTIDHTHKKIKMTSLMRDMYVQIPGHGKNKLNAAFTYGGGNLLLKTIYSNFGIKIDRFVCVDYKVFASVVDTLGGVEVEIEEMELEQFNKYVSGGKKNRIAKAGTYNMNGKQALSYCRIRKVGTDTARTARQRKVLREIMKKCRSLSPTEAQRILSIAAPYVTTNMSRDEMTSLAMEGLGSLKYDTMGLRIPMDGAWGDLKIDGIWYVEVDLKKNARFISQFIYGDDETAQKLADKQQKSDDKKAESARSAYERNNKKKNK